jgi:hypothetical protein
MVKRKRVATGALRMATAAAILLAVASSAAFAQSAGAIRAQEIYSSGSLTLTPASGTTIDPSINGACVASAQSGADAGAKIAACLPGGGGIGALPTAGGVIDARGFTSAETISTPILLGAVSNITFLFGRTTFTCSHTCFQLWSSTTSAATNLAFYGSGVGVTIFKIASSATCSSSSTCNAFGLHNPADTSDADPNSSYITIKDMTLDGNKSNVTNPTPTYDVSHQGILSNGTASDVFDNIEAKNWWFAGIGLGLYSSYNSIRNLQCSNDGQGGTSGYGCLAIQGTSNYNTASFTSDGDTVGAWLINNLEGNRVTGTCYDDSQQCLVLGDSGSTVTETENVVSVTSVGTPQACSIFGPGKQIDNTVDCVSTGGALSIYAQTVNVGSTATHNRFNFTVSHSEVDGVDVAGSYNQIAVNLTDNSQNSPLGGYAIQLSSGATGNYVYGVLTDDQGTHTQNGMNLNAGSANNFASILSTNSGYTADNGTQNILSWTRDGLTLSAKARTFSDLPSCGAAIEGTTSAITDSTTTTWGATITGSGSNHVLAYCDGTNWTVAAK